MKWPPEKTPSGRMQYPVTYNRTPKWSLTNTCLTIRSRAGGVEANSHTYYSCIIYQVSKIESWKYKWSAKFNKAFLFLCQIWMTNPRFFGEPENIVSTYQRTAVLNIFTFPDLKFHQKFYSNLESNLVNLVWWTGGVPQGLGKIVLKVQSRGPTFKMQYHMAIFTPTLA